jgi:Tol biopolymer transport system component
VTTSSLPKRGLALALLATCFFLLAACAGDASFKRGVTGVRLPQWIGEEAAWSPDGKWLAIPVESGIRLRNVETGKVRQVQAPVLQGFPEDPGPLSWAADGRTLRYVTSDGPRDENVSWLTEVRRDGSGLRQSPLPVKAQTLDWGPQGLPLAFTTGAYAIDFEKGLIGPKPALYVVDGIDQPAQRIVQILHGGREADIFEPQFSPDGARILYKREERHRVSLWTIRPDGSSPRALATGLGYADGAVWSPDGRRIALTALAGASRRSYLSILPASGGKLRRVGDQEVLYGPVWSPDGRWLTYSTYESEIRRVRPDGSGDHAIAQLPGQEIRGLLWSPDGRRLAYTARDFPPSD